MKFKIFILINYFLINSFDFAQNHKNTLSKPNIIIVAMDNAYFKLIGGYPVDSRMKYIPLLNKIKEYDPKLIFLNIAFVRKPSKIENMFARKANQFVPLVVPATPSTDNISENYFENRELLKIKVPTYHGEKPENLRILSGIFLPYPEMLKHSKSVFINYSPYDQEAISRDMCLYAEYDDYIFQCAGLGIMNILLDHIKKEISIDSEKNALFIQGKQRKSEKKYIFNIPDHQYELKIPMKFNTKMTVIPANQILSDRRKLSKGDIVIIGITADGAVNKANTPIGQISGSELLGYEIMTLYELIKDIP